MKKKNQKAEEKAQKLARKLAKTKVQSKAKKLKENFQKFLDKTDTACPEAVASGEDTRPKTNFSSTAVGTLVKTPQELARRLQREQRFKALETADHAHTGRSLVDSRAEGSTAIGTCSDLEKEYLRLTSLPDVASVRPPKVLKAALELTKKKWLDKPDYESACEQLKSIRQDLTVQYIKDELTVEVYETHARLALEMDDYCEYNRCQTVLKELYADGILGNQAEFIAYRILYALAYQENLHLELRHLPMQLRQHPFIKHALQVCKAIKARQHWRFFELFNGAPRMSPYLMDPHVKKLRDAAYSAIIKAYNAPPRLPLTFLQWQLGFSHPKHGQEDLAKFIRVQGGVVDLENGFIDVQLSRSAVIGPPRA
eukprot:gene4363-5369_t